jgi:hypothetical protein
VNGKKSIPQDGAFRKHKQAQSVPEIINAGAAKICYLLFAIRHPPFGVSRMVLDLRSDAELSEFRPHVVLLLGILRQLQRFLNLSGTRTNVSLFSNHETLAGKRWWIVRIFG